MHCVSKRIINRFLIATTVVTFTQTVGVDASEPEAVQREAFDLAYANEQFRRVTMLGIQLEKDFPGHPLTRYRLACAYAMIERPIASGQWLKKAAEVGFSDIHLASNDVHLVSVRMDPAYIEALKLIRKNHDRGVIGGHHTGSRPIQYVPKDLGKEQISPLLVLLHGYGTDGHDIINPWKTIADEFDLRLVAPQAPHPTQNGFRWGPADEAEPIIMRAIKYMEDNYRIDRQRVVLSGFSQGGLLTYAIGLKHPKKFSGLLPIAGRYPGMNQAEKAPQPQLPKIFIMIGTDDRPLADNRKASRELQSAGYSVKLNEYEGVGHHLPANFREEFKEALRFFWPN
ncbi:MAG: alpha/beta hydrolase [Phycisphaerae bacterium]